MKKYFPLQSGFTLVEVLVSITLLLLVIVGPMQILTRANHSTAFATEQMTAWFLAQEGLELAQNGRDGYLLQYFKGDIPDPWHDFKTGSFATCFAGPGCGFSIDEDGVLTADTCDNLGGGGCQLYLDTTSSRMSYTHDSSGGHVKQPYSRVIHMTETGAGREILVTSTVTWRTGSLIASQQVVTSTYLFNVYDTN